MLSPWIPDSISEVLISGACHPDIDHGYNASYVVHALYLNHFQFYKPKQEGIYVCIMIRISQGYCC